MLAVLHRNHHCPGRKRIDLRQLRDDTLICAHTIEGLGLHATSSALGENAGLTPTLTVFSPQASILNSMAAAASASPWLPLRQWRSRLTTCLFPFTLGQRRARG